MIYLPPCLSFLFVLHFILACVRSENFFFSEPTEPNFNDLVNDATLNLNENDPLNVAYLNSDELTWDFSDPVLNPIIQDEADPFINANDPFAGDNLLDLATLPDSCGIKDSPTNDVLRARDGKSCSPRKDNVDLPSGLFQDPEGYLRENVLPLPTGPSDSLDQGNIKEGDLGFGAFIRNRPFPVTPLEPNLQICDPRIFGLSNVPMCDNHLTGSVAKEPSKIYQYNLINAVPCRCFISYCQGEC